MSRYDSGSTDDIMCSPDDTPSSDDPVTPCCGDGGATHTYCTAVSSCQSVCDNSAASRLDMIHLSTPADTAADSCQLTRRGAGRLWRTLRTLRLPRRRSPSVSTSCDTPTRHGVADGAQHSTVHTTVDYTHSLVPDLQSIIATPFYWGRMDRYEAETLLDGRPEGTFLLRDSAQHDYLFSVSFRRYVRSLHARVEHCDGVFTFDSHDPGVYASNTVTGLIEHYKDPASCMFFEPMLTRPLHRTFVFPLADLCRAVVVSLVTYDDISRLCLPKMLKHFLMEYHYRRPVRVERFDVDS